ncbi:TetR/AcrR family transcriptional regulator [Sporolactobacillus kofuensis]|uniref:TetR/AcrR family transcriptional regulator n=1 Tax=Sporolactobacillus kofuensis TaxID=269672 RepID=A0ABW1WHD7_9BACL|nr:TetR/AcrR family transcriptional regulator [Sporolactobacillus kofuensis]MCO7175783.1 TetR/AcrR family transcriptional regulator [Sporolactobacillus kofuensis]
MSDQPQRRDANEISKSILQTTESLFSQYGVGNVSMHQIAKAANVGQGTMYRRYANKGDLCLELMSENFHALQEHMLQSLAELKAEPVKVRMQALFKLHLKFLEKHTQLFETIHSYITCTNTTKPFYEKAPYIFLHQTIRSLLEEAIESKESRPINADFTAHTLIASMNPKIYNFLRQKNGYSAKEVIENVNKTLLEPLFIEKK